MVKNPHAYAGSTGSILGQEDPLEKEMATPCSFLVWEIPWPEETGRLQTMGSQRLRKDSETKQPPPLREQIHIENGNLNSPC